MRRTDPVAGPSAGVARSPRAPRAAALITLLLLAACTGEGEAAGRGPSQSAAAPPVTTPAGTGSGLDGADTAVERLRERLTPPALPSFALPTYVLVDAGN